MRIEATPGTVTVPVASGVAVIGLPTFFDTATILEVDPGVLSFDLYGRLTRLDAGAEIRNSFGYLGAMNLSNFEYSFNTTRLGFLRFSLEAPLGLTVGVGLSSFPAEISVFLDELPLAGFVRGVIVGVSNGDQSAVPVVQAMGIELRTPDHVPLGSHVLRLAITNGPVVNGALDIHLCQ
jgi:hypothetical protein